MLRCRNWWCVGLVVLVTGTGQAGSAESGQVRAQFNLRLVVSQPCRWATVEQFDQRLAYARTGHVGGPVVCLAGAPPKFTFSTAHWVGETAYDRPDQEPRAPSEAVAASGRPGVLLRIEY